jgi:hypothetical protein
MSLETPKTKAPDVSVRHESVDPMVLVLFDPRGDVKMTTTAQRFQVLDENVVLQAGYVTLIKREHWEAIKLDRGGQFLLGQVNPRDETMLFCVADGSNLIRDYIDGARDINPYSIKELIEKTYSTELLNRWLEWFKNQPAGERNTDLSRQIEERLDDYRTGALVELPDYDRDGFPGKKVGRRGGVR